MSIFYYVGLDISKFKHDGYIIDESGSIINNGFTFPNDQTGFDYLKSILLSLGPSKENIFIGLESTGHYGKLLKKFLTSHNYNFMEINPIHTANFRKALNVAKIKNDKIDSKIIITTMRELGFKKKESRKPEYDKLKLLYREHIDYTNQKAKYLVKLNNYCDKCFPELQSVIEIKSEVAKYLISKFPNLKSIVKANKEKLFSKLYSISRGRLSRSSFDKIIDLSKNTIGVPDEIEYQLAILAIKTIESVNICLKKIESQIESILDIIDTPLKGIKGVGIVSVAAIIGEYGLFETFDNSEQALKFAGIIPNLDQSGTKSTYGKMAKCGSHLLRRTLMNLMLPLRQSQHYFYELYHKKRQNGKHDRVACSHMVNKFIRIVFYLTKNNKSFKPSVLNQ